MLITDQHKKSIIYLVQHKGNCITQLNCGECFYDGDCCVNSVGVYEKALQDLKKYFTEEEIFEAFL